VPDAFDGAGRRLALGRRLGRGGEGEVFEVAGQPGLVAKVLFPRERTPARLAKLEAMVAAPPAGAYGSVDGFPVLTWPTAVLYGERRDFVGYSMARVQPADFVPFSTLVSAARRRGLGGNPLTWDRMVLLALRLAHVVRTLHRFGYAVGDLNDRNVLVSRRLTPLLMDTDSFQVPKPNGRGHHPSVVGDAQYWAPELLDVDLRTHGGSRVQGDLHALGVLLFQLFMGGWRPYQASGSAVAGIETPAAKAKAGLFAWDAPRPGVLEPPASAPSYAALPEPVRRLLRRCLVDGHRKPSRRPTADEWHDALRRLRDDGFQPCRRDPRHVFGRRERACPWCGDPNDRFAAVRARAPRPVSPAPVARPVQPAPASAARAAKPNAQPQQQPQPPARPPPRKKAAPTPARPAPKPAKRAPARRAAAARPKRVRRRSRSAAAWMARGPGWLSWALLSLAMGLLAFKAG
jgi:DNA-binding helix-hairpin-helix protein with protein kinase domain